MGVAGWVEVEDEEQGVHRIPRHKHTHCIVVLGISLRRILAVCLVREDDLAMILRDALLGSSLVILSNLGHGSQSAAILQGTYDSLPHRLGSEHGPQPDLADHLGSECAVHELFVQHVAAVVLDFALAEKPLREEDPLVGELGDDEADVGIHAISHRRVRQVADPHLVVRVLVHGVLPQRTAPQELRRGHNRLVVGRDDHGERRDTAVVEILACQSIGL
mmetsp:Transcript_30003/g.99358  ORF Transcript_30003/g.99358 Transcript_30003/m.99358 type:complete len:219 (-) Transcript_30003:3776-4432(-)